MAKSAKRFYWLKLKEDFFDDDTISWIEEQDNGKEYCLFYLKLCLKSLKTNGLLIRNVGEILVPYNTKKLAELTRTDHDTVVVAMQLFQRIGLIQVLENGEIYLSQLGEMVGSETDKAAMMRRHRQQIAVGNIVTGALPERYTEKEIEKEKDIDIEKEIEKEEPEPGNTGSEKKKKKKSEPVRHKYGEYNNVLLSDEDMAKLQKEFPEDWERRIANLSSYMASHGKTYKDHLATIRNWARKDQERVQHQRKQSPDAAKLPSGELPY